jgi:hypothetical protein
MLFDLATRFEEGEDRYLDVHQRSSLQLLMSRRVVSGRQRQRRIHEASLRDSPRVFKRVMPSGLQLKFATVASHGSRARTVAEVSQGGYVMRVTGLHQDECVCWPKDAAPCSTVNINGMARSSISGAGYLIRS